MRQSITTAYYNDPSRYFLCDWWSEEDLRRLQEDQKQEIAYHEAQQAMVDDYLSLPTIRKSE